MCWLSWGSCTTRRSSRCITIATASPTPHVGRSCAGGRVRDPGTAPGDAASRRPEPANRRRRLLPALALVAAEPRPQAMAKKSRERLNGALLPPVGVRPGPAPSAPESPEPVPHLCGPAEQQGHFSALVTRYSFTRAITLPATSTTRCATLPRFDLAALPHPEVEPPGGE